MTLRIAYFVNRHPAVSHTFIRREILALETLGFEVVRIALRGWQGELVDEADFRERSLTRYVLQQRPLQLARQMLTLLVASPRSFFASLWLALRMGWRGARSLPYHLGYFIEACGLVIWLQESGVTHVHAHFGTNSTEVVMLANALGGPPYSFTVHGPEEFDSPGPLRLQEKVKRSAFVVAISSYGRAQLYRWVEHTNWHKVKVVHCGLEKEYFESSHEPISAAARLVCIGRLNEQKGQLLLLEAAKILVSRGVQFELVLVGSGELREKLESVIREYALEPYVQLTGALSSQHVREEILRARALVLPSFAEGLPIVIMEAMALRRPVLSTYVAGIPELIRPDENGWLIPPGSVALLAEAMEKVLGCTAQELKTMGDNAWSRVQERHSIDQQALILSELFKASVLNSASADRMPSPE